MDTPIYETETETTPTPRHHGGRGATTMTAENLIKETEQQQIMTNGTPRRDIPPQGLALPAKENMLAGLTEEIPTIVHYVAYNGRNLTALVIERSTNGKADLAVFTNMTNAAGKKNFGLQFHEGVEYSTGKTPGTWHSIGQ